MLTTTATAKDMSKAELEALNKSCFLLNKVQYFMQTNSSLEPEMSEHFINMSKLASVEALNEIKNQYGAVGYRNVMDSMKALKFTPTDAMKYVIMSCEEQPNSIIAEHFYSFFMLYK